jgi:hypothetical protein
LVRKTREYLTGDMMIALRGSVTVGLALARSARAPVPQHSRIHGLP